MGTKLGNHLQTLRKTMKLSQEEAAEKIEALRLQCGYSEQYAISRSSLANFEAGLRRPNYFKLVMLSAFYDENIERLFHLAYDSTSVDPGEVVLSKEVYKGTIVEFIPAEKLVLFYGVSEELKLIEQYRMLSQSDKEKVRKQIERLVQK